MGAFKGNRKEHARVWEMHQRYLACYKAFNNGSLAGATPFHQFYVYWTYTTRYADMRQFALISYR